jgi:hypothetical protein
MGNDQELTIKTSPIKFKVEKDGIEYEFEPIGDITDLAKLKEDIIGIVKRFNIVVRQKNMITITKQPQKHPENRNDILDIWDNIEQFLGEEFTADEYWNALKKSGYKYAESARQVTPYQHTTKLILHKKIERIIDTSPVTWRKLYLKANDECTKELIDPSSIAENRLTK